MVWLTVNMLTGNMINSKYIQNKHIIECNQKTLKNEHNFFVN